MPHSNDSPNLEQLKLETERSRDQLAQTVHQIRNVVSDATADIGERIAPETIKANIGDYIRTRGEDIFEAARQNPMQAAAVGAIAAYPALALARRIPAPLIMIGAGLFLMNSETGRNFSQKATERAGDLADRGQRIAQDWRDKSTDTLASVAEQASSVGSSFRSSVNQKPGDAIGATPTDALASWARENPITTAAIGLAVGGLVASALPVTRAEAQFTQTATADLRRRLGDAERQGVSAATEAVDRIAERTSQQGLTPETVADAARDFGERALKVAEAATDAALARPDQHEDSHTPAGG